MGECAATARNGDNTALATGGSSVTVKPCFTFDGGTDGAPVVALGLPGVGGLAGYWVEMSDPTRTAIGITFTMTIVMSNVGYLPGHGSGDPEPIRRLPAVFLFDDGAGGIVIPDLVSCTVEPPAFAYPPKTIYPVLSPIDSTMALIVGVDPVPASSSDVTVIDVELSIPPTAGARMAVLTLQSDGFPSTLAPYVWECTDPVDPVEPIPTPPVECLGGGTYSIDVVRRPTRIGKGGPFLPGDDLELIGGNYGRKLGATSTAGVTVSVAPECGDSIRAMVDLAVLELEIWRELPMLNRGTSRRLAWSGPITDLLENGDGTYLITAADDSYYVTDERLTRPRSWTDVDLATIFAQAIADALADDDPGIRITATPTGVLGSRSIAAADAKPLGQVLGEIARTAVDWTVLGREWFVGGTQIDAASILPIQLTDDHFSAAPKIRVSRSAMATRQLIRGNGVIGSAGGPRDTDGVLIEKVADENSIIDQASADAAAATLWDRTHEPVTVIDGSGDAKLDADTPVTLETLIPGVGVPVNVGQILTYKGVMRLEAVSVDFTPDDEAVKITLQPVGTGDLT